MVYIGEGYFQMGANAEGLVDEKPAHFVFIAAFYIDKYEISNAQYAEFMQSTGHSAPKFWQDERFNKPDHPVVGVSWHDAVAYARWKGRRLPTEAEWEKAARGADNRLFPWGNKWDKGNAFNFVNIHGKEDRHPFTAPVKNYDAGASPPGVYNMAGNVWEWCLDWYQKDFYRFSPEQNPRGPEAGKMKVLRGGSWVNDIDSLQVTRRARNYPAVQNEFYGFRTVLPAAE